MRNDDSALCLWAYGIWGGISRKPLEIETWIQRTTNRKWPIPSPMVTWPMTSRDTERSKSWPRYVWCPLSRKRLEIETWWQWSIYRKWPPGNRMVTWSMTSRDPERSRLWHFMTLKVKIVPSIWYLFVSQRPGKQESCAIAKMTARCALYK